MKMCNAFSTAGVRMTLVVPRRLTTNRNLKNLPTSIWNFYGVCSNFEIKWLPFPYPVSKFQQSIHALMATLYAWTSQVSFVYTRSEWVAVILSRMGIPVILEVHQHIGGLALPMAARMACRNGRFVGLVCVSKTLAEKMIELGFPDYKVVVAHDGVDLSLFEPRLSKSEAREILNLPLDGQIVCHLGHLYYGRGIEVLISSAKNLQDTTFLMVGGNPSDIEYHRGHVHLQGLKNVQFIGVIPNIKVPAYLYAADVLVMPYTRKIPTIQYTSPMKMFEYMAAGRPIISSDFPVLREVLRHGENALLVPSSDSMALADAIKLALNDPLLAQRLGAQALEDVRAYTWDQRVQKILKFFKLRYNAE